MEEQSSRKTKTVSDFVAGLEAGVELSSQLNSRQVKTYLMTLIGVLLGLCLILIGFTASRNKHHILALIVGSSAFGAGLYAACNSTGGSKP